MSLSFKKDRKILCKEFIKQDNKEKQIIEEKGNRLYQLEEEKLIGRYAKKRETG
jgi:hypothetical protein